MTRVCAMSYVEAAMEADSRLKAGEHQHECARCGRWYWPLHRDEHEHAPTPAAGRPAPNIRARKRAACDDCRVNEGAPFLYSRSR